MLVAAEFFLHHSRHWVQLFCSRHVEIACYLLPQQHELARLHAVGRHQTVQVYTADKRPSLAVAAVPVNAVATGDEFTAKIPPSGGGKTSRYRSLEKYLAYISEKGGDVVRRFFRQDEMSILWRGTSLGARLTDRIEHGVEENRLARRQHAAKFPRLFADVEMT